MHTVDMTDRVADLSDIVDMGQMICGWAFAEGMKQGEHDNKVKAAYKNLSEVSCECGMCQRCDAIVNLGDLLGCA